MRLTEIHPNKSNPRILKDDRFKKLCQSIKDFPKMMELRPVVVDVVNNSMVTIGKSVNGKIRYRLCECQICGRWFHARKYCKTRHPKYCSNKCYSETLKIHRYCQMCGSEIHGNNASKTHRKYCSTKCAGDYRRDKPISVEWRKKLSEGRKRSVKCHGYNLYNWKGGIENTRRLNIARYHRKRSGGKIDELYLNILYKLQNGKCYYCGDELSGYRNKSIEHLIPTIKGGDNNWINLVYACKGCNSKKHDMTLAEFAIKNKRPDWLNNMVQFQAHYIQERLCNNN